MNPFTSFSLGGLTLANRFVRSATHEGLATSEGLPTPALAAALQRLAANHVGLLISGHHAVTAGGKASEHQSVADREEWISAWQPITATIRRSGAAVILQLAHAGGHARDAAIAAGPSPFKGNSGRECRELTRPEIRTIIAAFAAAAGRARRAGFDGVQIHAAHGYLISEFLSPYYNRRSDQYGGSLAGRTRLLNEVYEAVRAEVGRDFPVTAKINSEDFLPGGFSADECLAVLKELAGRGLDAAEISGGLPEAGPKHSPVRTVDPDRPEEPVYYEKAAARIRREVNIPVMLVGGVRFVETAERLLEDRACDLVSLCRPLIREPELIGRWQGGDRRKASCISCNACFRPIMTGRGFYCPVEKKLPDA